ncbi:putative nitrate reductase [Leptomonas seymouri]|uniref:Putative nitrate reductase n=1 Tax=Leptomonas seymouri TaxID=5684 RepID=A0A0N1HZN6_LEPSE|nr:putative nitrate reductase [Leptomonas seymouri]|eukprot:KPI88723.1 putative nitrate reductase [Leptomonas seymouri]
MGQKNSRSQHRGEGPRDSKDLFQVNAPPVMLQQAVPEVGHTTDHAKKKSIDAHPHSDLAHHRLAGIRPIADDPVIAFSATVPVDAEAAAAPSKVYTHALRGSKAFNLSVEKPVNSRDSRPARLRRRSLPATADTESTRITQTRKAPGPNNSALQPLQVSPEPPAPSQEPKSETRTFTEAEIKSALAADPDRIIVVIQNNVYDVTHFVDTHPGGPSVLRHNNGKDITDTFFMMHGPETASQLPEFFMGRLVTEEELHPPAVAAKEAAVASQALSLDSIRNALQRDPERLILIMFGDAYDITPMRSTHPGGLRVLLNYNGKECGDVFMRIHGPRAKKQAQQYLMGRISEAGDRPSPLRRFAEPAANSGPRDGNPVNPRLQSTRILEKKMINDAGTLQCFTYSCCEPLHLTPGGHVKIFSDVPRNEWCYYSPFQSGMTSFKICVKRCPNSRTSNYMFSQPVGQEMHYEGPFAPSWELGTDAHVKKAKLESRHILLLAGGTGVAPMYAIAASELEKQTASVTLVCSVQMPDDLMLTEEIHQLAVRYVGPMPGRPHKLRVALAYSRFPNNLPPPPAPIKYTRRVQCGRHVDADFLVALELPPIQAAVLCGPPAFSNALASTVLKLGLCSAECIHIL